MKRRATVRLSQQIRMDERQQIGDVNARTSDRETVVERRLLGSLCQALPLNRVRERERESKAGKRRRNEVKLHAFPHPLQSLPAFGYI